MHNTSFSVNARRVSFSDGQKILFSIPFICMCVCLCLTVYFFLVSHMLSNSLRLHLVSTLDCILPFALSFILFVCQCGFLFVDGLCGVVSTLLLLFSINRFLYCNYLCAILSYYLILLCFFLCRLYVPVWLCYFHFKRPRNFSSYCLYVPMRLCQSLVFIDNHDKVHFSNRMLKCFHVY